MNDGEKNNDKTEVMYKALSNHIINLNEGRFSTEGEFTTSEGDIERIFSEVMPAAYKETTAASRPLRIVFYAHGGLIAEKEGLQIAYNQLDWWKSNGIYPVFFVWETGFLETISQLLNSNIKGRRTRDLADHTTDPIIERLSRSLGAQKIWSAMKYSASEAHREVSGGGWIVARHLVDFLKIHSNTEVHAVGHSAGSIFHSHFVPCCIDAGLPKFNSLQFLAPAISVDAFHERLSDKVTSNIDYTTIYTMKEGLERDDNTAKVYRKSLLYLVGNALESKRNTPILGLEESVQSDSQLKQLFGLSGSSGAGEIIWSKTATRTGDSSSVATTHGGFDNDPVTMNSVLRRILGVGKDEKIKDFPIEAEKFVTRAITLANSGVRSFDDDDEFDLIFEDEVASDNASSVVPPQNNSKNRRALCIGINEYPNPRHELYGCVADANTWLEMFKQLGFSQVDLLLDQEATREGILSAINELVSQTKPGDTLVLQYSGHGTQVTDYDFDERMAGVNPGQNDGKDEALCPVDFESGRLLIDDDLKMIFQKIPEGSNLTCFFDCCHSATISRGLGQLNPVPDFRDSDVRQRTVVISREVESKYKEFRNTLDSEHSNSRDIPTMKEVTFSACRASEVALERNGQGDFTRYAMQVLNQRVEGMTNAEFLDEVITAFGDDRKQNPNMDSSGAAMMQPFLV